MESKNKPIIDISRLINCLRRDFFQAGYWLEITFWTGKKDPGATCKKCSDRTKKIEDCKCDLLLRFAIKAKYVHKIN